MDFKKILFKSAEIDVESALPDAVIFCDKEGKIQWVTDVAADIFNTQKMHLLTSNISDFIENALNLILSAVSLKKVLITKKVDEETYFEMSAKEINEGYVISLRPCTNANVSNESVINEDYKVVNRSKNNFLMKLTNDFKSPLQSIVGFSQAMADGLGGSMSLQQEKYIKIIKKNSSDLMYFMDKLVGLSVSEIEPLPTDKKTFDIINLINATVRYNQQLYQDKEVRWNINVDENVKNTVISDETLVKTVLQNVLEVILKVVDMGELSINISIPDAEYLQSKNIAGTYIMISVQSSSLLLSESDLENLFDPYKIVDSSNRKNLLRAMSLATVKNILQALGGYIWVESKILKNTNFNILIPQEQN